MDRLLNVSDAAQLLAIPKRRVWLLGRRGVLPVVRLGKRQVRYSAAALGMWIADGGLAATGCARPSAMPTQPSDDGFA